MDDGVPDDPPNEGEVRDWLLDQGGRLGEAIATHETSEIGLELPGLQQMDARQRRAHHVEQLLRGRLLLQEPKLVDGEPAVVPVDAPAELSPTSYS